MKPGLAVILVGEDPASQIYVRNKGIACEKAGFYSVTIRMPAETSQEDLEAQIRQLNADDRIHGILVQLPLPRHLDEASALATIVPEKDVDGFHVVNAGKLMNGLNGVVACTPKGAMEMIRRTGVDLRGKEAVVVGRSNIVGKPMATLLMQKTNPGDCTVTICHSHTQNIVEECRQADIIIAALGQPGFVTADMVKPGAVIIDVGTTRVPDATKKSGFRLSGDVRFDEVAPLCSYITPVPGGVGPMTICSLMKNTLLAGKKSIYR